MTRPVFQTLFFGVVLSVVLPSMAQNIAYVDAPRLLKKTPQGKELVKNLETEFSERDRSLRAKLQSFREKQIELEKNALILSQEEIQHTRNELADMQILLQREKREFNEDFARSRSRQMGKLEKDISDAISRIAKTENIDLVLQDVVFASDKINITDRVLEILSKQWTQ